MKLVNACARTLRHAQAYPAANQKGLADLCLYQLATVYACAYRY